MRFGPAGIPLAVDGDTLEGLKYTAKIGLKAYEVEFVRGVHMGKEKALELGKNARELGVSLSCHGPYWINCAARDKLKIARSIHNIMDSARAMQAMGGGVVVIHPAFYMERDKGEVYEQVKETLSLALEKIKAERLDKILIGLETSGKPTQFGTVEEVSRLSIELSQVIPVFDFAHLHAVRNGWIKGKEQYSQIFDEVEKILGGAYLKHFHSHYSNIEYTIKGERRHLEFSPTSGEPPFKPLAELIVERGYDGTIICETPLLDQDALLLQKIFKEAGGKA
ncbi:MAG: TIM barrel protein [Candidatus Micrarchaeota archaeon]